MSKLYLNTDDMYSKVYKDKLLSILDITLFILNNYNYESKVT